MILLAQIIHRLIQLLVVIVFIKVILSYVMDPYQPVRRFFDRLVDPMLAPIRRFVPPVGMLDLSAMILIVGLMFLDRFINRLLLSFV